MQISVAVPVRDEASSIRLLLDGLLHQTHPPNEIVIADSGSQDDTAAIIEEFIGNGASIKLLRGEAGLPGRGRNLAARNAASEWIAFIDAGTRPAADWLAQMVRKVSEDRSIDVVYGSYEPVVDSFFEQCAAIAYVPAACPTPDGPTRPRSIVSALMRRKVWETVGGFPEDLRSAEDLLFMTKVEQAGFQSVRAPQAVVYWAIQPGLWRTFRRFVSYARNNIRAGLWRQWQAAIFQRYGLIFGAGLPTLFLGIKWLTLPLILWLLLLFARAIKAVRQNRHSYPAGIFRNGLRLLLIAPIIATIDAATFMGSINWLLSDKFHLTRKRHEHYSR